MIHPYIFVVNIWSCMSRKTWGIPYEYRVICYKIHMTNFTCVVISYHQLCLASINFTGSLFPILVFHLYNKLPDFLWTYDNASPFKTCVKLCTYMFICLIKTHAKFYLCDDYLPPVPINSTDSPCYILIFHLYQNFPV